MNGSQVGVFIGIGIWVVIFLVWYWKTYPDRVRKLVRMDRLKFKWPRPKRKVRPTPQKPKVSRPKDFKDLVHTVESICAKDRFYASDAATLVEAVMELMEIESASGQIWEAYALDTLERADIICDECGVEVEKTVRKTGVRIQCKKCEKWLALRNSKVTVIDPNRQDLEDWETQQKH
jgi:hypothetical protein